MNRGVLQSSPVQQMVAAGSPNCWWNTNNMRQPPPPQSSSVSSSSSSFLVAPPPPPPTLFPPHPPTSSAWNNDNHQELPESWSQLLLGGLVGEEEKSSLSNMQEASKNLENWEEQLLLQQQQHQTAPAITTTSVDDDVKQENSSSVNSSNNNNMYANSVEFHEARGELSWSQQMMSVSSPKSCVTTLSSNMLDFSSKSTDARHHPPPEHPSECNSTAATGGAVKKARVQPSSTQSTFKVRKEKLGDRITALHQLVSPFGKTDTASVLLEAIGYIRFLESQIEALSLPYLGSGSGNNMRNQQHPVHPGDRSCLFPEDPGQLLNDGCMKTKVSTTNNQEYSAKKNLRSRGLCLVPVSSCTLQVGSDNGAPALGGGGGFRL